MRNTRFGQSPSKTPYTIELGANWVDGIESANDENPIWTLAKIYSLKTVEQTLDGIRTYDQNGEANFSHVLEEYQSAKEWVSNLVADLQKTNSDIRLPAALRNVGWIPDNQYKSSVEGVLDAPNEASDLDSMSTVCTQNDCNGADKNDKFGNGRRFSIDQRGFNILLVDEANTFLAQNDSRLLLNTIVKDVNYTDRGVTITNSDGSCISAEYAICTFSVGVLQNRIVHFQPLLPTEKQRAFDFMEMGVLTKIFMQFNETFWPTDTQGILYSDPHQQGYFGIYLSLNLPSMLPDSNILTAWVAGSEARCIERQTDEETKKEVMTVLRSMSPNVTVPEPLYFMCPRWGQWEWVFGSYTTYPVGFTPEMHKQMGEHVGRLWFAGEGVSRNSNGYLHSAYISGKYVGESIIPLLRA